MQYFIILRVSVVSYCEKIYLVLKSSNEGGLFFLEQSWRQYCLQLRGMGSVGEKSDCDALTVSGEVAAGTSWGEDTGTAKGA